MAYLFVHFKEKNTPDGEQVYFSISLDGFKWEEVKSGTPVLTNSLGEKGCRDIEIIRLQTGGFVIITTDLCIVNRMNRHFQIDWHNIMQTGSTSICMWKTNDLVTFSEQKLIDFSKYNFGCIWAPEIFFDENNKEYVLHWSSTIKGDTKNHMSIYCCTTKDFETFSPPKLYFTKDTEILDSHITKTGNTYHLFYKNANNPSMNMHATSDHLYGPFKHDENFERFMSKELGNPGCYEAPTTYTLPDGRWCLMLDFFGCEKEKMGYVPFLSSCAGDCRFKKVPELFSFPYGFKHGRVIEITQQEYNRLKHL